MARSRRRVIAAVLGGLVALVFCAALGLRLAGLYAQRAIDDKIASGQLKEALSQMDRLQRADWNLFEIAYHRSDEREYRAQITRQLHTQQRAQLEEAVRNNTPAPKPYWTAREYLKLEPEDRATRSLVLRYLDQQIARCDDDERSFSCAMALFRERAKLDKSSEKLREAYRDRTLRATSRRLREASDPIAAAEHAEVAIKILRRLLNPLYARSARGELGPDERHTRATMLGRRAALQSTLGALYSASPTLWKASRAKLLWRYPQAQALTKRTSLRGLLIAFADPREDLQMYAKIDESSDRVEVLMFMASPRTGLLDVEAMTQRIRALAGVELAPERLNFPEDAKPWRKRGGSSTRDFWTDATRERKVSWTQDGLEVGVVFWQESFRMAYVGRAMRLGYSDGYPRTVEVLHHRKLRKRHLRVEHHEESELTEKMAAQRARADDNAALLPMFMPFRARAPTSTTPTPSSSSSSVRAGSRSRSSWGSSSRRGSSFGGYGSGK